jgi:hypothetical protein
MSNFRLPTTRVRAGSAPRAMNRSASALLWAATHALRKPALKSVPKRR